MKIENPNQNSEIGNGREGWLKVGETITITGEGDHEIKKVASSMELADELGLKMNRDIPVYYLKGISKRQGAYHPESDTVLIFENMTQEHTLKHELVHIVEFKQEKTPELQALYERAKEKITEKSFDMEVSNFFNFNFMKDIHEFIADGYSEAGFISALKKEGLYEEFLKETGYLFK